MQVLKDPTPYRLSLRERIMEKAMQLFAAHGIRAVKMDDIASELGISKRTLYEIFVDKEQLLYEGIKAYDERKHLQLLDYINQGHHVLDIILEVYRMKVEETRKISLAFYADIIRYPQLADYIKNNNERMRERFLQLMQRGVEEGYLRPEVNYKMIPHMTDAVGQYILSTDLIDQYTIQELFSNYFLVMLRGLCTSKGLKVVEEAGF